MARVHNKQNYDRPVFYVDVGELDFACAMVPISVVTQISSR